MQNTNPWLIRSPTPQQLQPPKSDPSTLNNPESIDMLSELSKALQRYQNRLLNSSTFDGLAFKKQPIQPAIVNSLPTPTLQQPHTPNIRPMQCSAPVTMSELTLTKTMYSAMMHDDIFTFDVDYLNQQTHNNDEF